MKKLLLVVLILNYISSQAQIIPANRIANWSNAGYPDSFPQTTTILNVSGFGAIGDSLTDNLLFIQNAIDSLHGRKGVIYFPAGKFLVSSSITLPDSVILRGNSSDSTSIIFNFNGITGNGFNVSGTITGNFANVTAGATINNNFIVVDSSNSFTAGCYAELLENNGSWDTQPVFWADNSVGQILKITSVSGDTLFFNSPLRINYTDSLNPRVRRIEPAKEIGIECMQLIRVDTAASTNYNIWFNYAANCWVRGVESAFSVGSHIEIDASTHITITGCYIHHSYLYDGVSTHGYGITLFNHSGECLITNNIMKHLRHSFSFQTGANGNVVSYNYSIDPNRSEAPSNAGADISLHGHYPYANLFEGNIVQNIQIDQTHGPAGPFNTFFRNRAELYGLVMTSATVQSDSQNFVGNEIPNTQILMGNYVLAGSGHFEYANNVRGVITPAGATSLGDSSYYLNAAPSFWQGTFPTIGMPNAPSSGSIPARDRYLSGSGFTVCDESILLATNNMNEYDLSIYPNPASTLIHIQTSEYLNGSILLKDINGRKLSVETITGKNFTINLPVNLSAGLYFIEIQTVQLNVVKKILVVK